MPCMATRPSPSWFVHALIAHLRGDTAAPVAVAAA
jgi:hypothetical protein